MVMVIMTTIEKKVYTIKSIRFLSSRPNFTKNHEITDYLLEKACERKGILFEPKKIDNTEEEAAKQVLIKRAKENKNNSI